jgi:uncharacterized protein YbaP (TraB family)
MKTHISPDIENQGLDIDSLEPVGNVKRRKARSPKYLNSVLRKELSIANKRIKELEAMNAKLMELKRPKADIRELRERNLKLIETNSRLLNRIAELEGHKK